MTGLPALRQQVAGKIARSYGATVNPDSEVTITPGADGGDLLRDPGGDPQLAMKSSCSIPATTAMSPRSNWPVDAVSTCN